MCEYRQNIKENSIWVGTMHYQAPEMLNSLVYNEKIDLWATGVIIYLLIVKKLPFKNKNNNRMIIHKKIRTKEVTFPVSSENTNLFCNDDREFISKLLCRDVEKRYNAEQALVDIWFDCV